MDKRFTEEIKISLGYITESKGGEIVGTWLWKDGSMTVSTKNRFLQDKLSQGVLRRGIVLDLGQIELTYSDSYVATAKFTPVELSSILFPDYICITNEERARKEVVLPANEGHNEGIFKMVFRGYVLEQVKGREITIGIWFNSPQGIVCHTTSNAFDRALRAIKSKLTTIEVTSKGAKEVPLKYKDANYFDITRKLPPRYYLVPSWGIEVNREDLLKELGI